MRTIWWQLTLRWFSVRRPLGRCLLARMCCDPIRINTWALRAIKAAKRGDVRAWWGRIVSYVRPSLLWLRRRHKISHVHEPTADAKQDEGFEDVFSLHRGDYWGSATSSAYEFPQENGRTYHAVCCYLSILEVESMGPGWLTRPMQYGAGSKKPCFPYVIFGFMKTVIMGILIQVKISRFVWGGAFISYSRHGRTELPLDFDIIKEDIDR